MLAYLSVARAFDSLAFAPFTEGIAVELRATIADDIAWGFSGFGYGPSQEGTDCLALGCFVNAATPITRREK
jgi:hypothetical protein